MKGSGQVPSDVDKCISNIYRPSSIISLDRFLEIIGGESLVQVGDPDEFVSFVNSTMVVPGDGGAQFIARPQRETASVSIEDVLNRFISWYVRSSDAEFRDRNVLTLGYRRKRWESQGGMRSHMDVECFHVNTVQNYWMRPYWRLVLARIGELLFSRILACPVFVPTDHKCYVQIAGTPVSVHVFGQGLHGSSSVRDANDSSRLWEERLPRYAIFYKHKYVRQPGFGPRHILSRRSTNPVSLRVAMFGEHALSKCTSITSRNNLNHLLESVCAQVLSNARVCSYSRPLEFYCPLASETQSASLYRQTEQTAPHTMDPCDIVAQGGRQERRVGVKTLFREKTRRGRRAGVSAREKSRSRNLCSTSEATSDESLGPTNKDEEESFS